MPRMTHATMAAIVLTLTASAPELGAQTFDFSSGEEGWYAFTDPVLYPNNAYVVELDTALGSPSAPSLRLRGNYAGSPSLPQRFGIRREVSTGGSATMTLSFRYRLTCHPDYAASGYNNLWLRVRDGSSGDRLSEIRVYPTPADASTSDTGWRTYTSPILNSSGTGTMSIQIFLRDTTPTMDPDVDQRILIDRVVVAFGDAVAPPPPSSVSYSPNPNTGAFTVSWSASSDPSGIANYAVRRSGNGGSTWTTVAASVTGTSLAQSGVAPGTYIYQIAARDGAGNLGAYSTNVNSVSVTGDSAPTVVVAPSGVFRASTPITFSLTFSRAVSGLTAADIVVTNGAVGTLSGTGSAYSVPVTPSAQGIVTCYLPAGVATDASGNPNAASNLASVTFDSIAPDTTLTTTPPTSTSSTGASFSFASNEAGIRFEASLDGAAYSVVTSPLALAGLAPGSHTFRVRARDAAGNVDRTPATYTWIVDTSAPDTSFAATPPAISASTSASFSFTSSETGSTFEASLDGAPFAAVSSPATLSALAQGSHTYRVRAVDAAGNSDSTPASYTWTVDTRPPQTTFTSTPPILSSSTSANFAFVSSESGSTFEGSLDGAAFAAVPNSVTLTGLARGVHTYRVRARDAAGNVDRTPASCTWTVDTDGPIAGRVADGWGADVDEQSSHTTLWANWSGFQDPETGVTGYAWAVGTAAGRDDVVPFTELGTATSASTSVLLPELELAAGLTYFVTVRARNALGLTTDVSSDGVRVLNAGAARPEPPSWRSVVAGRDVVRLEWKASPTPGISTYRVWWKRVDAAWSEAARLDVEDATSIDVGGLSVGVMYDFLLRAVDPLQNESLPISTQATPFIAKGEDGLLYGSLQEALDAARPGETVTLAAGAFPGPFRIGPGVSLVGAGALHTKLSGEAGVAVVRIDGDPSAAVLGTLADLAIEGGSVGVELAGSATLERLVIHRGQGPGVRVLATARLTMVNCTIAHNGEDGILAYGEVRVRNCVIGMNGGWGVQNLSAAEIRYTTSYGNAAGDWLALSASEGNDSRPAAFVDEIAGDYREAVGSPTIDTGDPADAFEREPEPNGRRVNRGAFGNTVWATSVSVVGGVSSSHARSVSNRGSRCGLVGLDGLLLVGAAFLLRRMRRIR